MGGFAWNMAGCFLLFRGVQMKVQWLKPWLKIVGSHVNIPGYASCSQNLKIALGFATGNPKPEYTSVLFVISSQNYTAPDGVRMNNEAYTSYPVESEILLMEGCYFYVLAVEKNVIIDNNHPDFEDFNGKSITILHLNTY